MFPPGCGREGTELIGLELGFFFGGEYDGRVNDDAKLRNIYEL